MDNLYLLENSITLYYTDRGNMKDLILLFTYFFSLRYIVISPNIINISIISVITTMFVIKYMRLKDEKIHLRKRSKNILKKLINKERNYFTEILQHDLKVPALAELRGINLLKSEILGSLNKEQKELLTQISNSCQYSLNMINMLNNTYKYIEYTNNYENFKLSDTIYDCFEELSNALKEKNIIISYINDEDTSIDANKKSIRKVLY